MGRFGFTTHSHTVEFIGPDYETQGEPDDFFAKFDAVIAGKDFEKIKNLIYHNNGHYNFTVRHFYGPSQHREYNNEIVDELFQFYDPLDRPPFPEGPQVAVEVARGVHTAVTSAQSLSSKGGPYVSTQHRHGRSAIPA
ncbi:hypothetical protein [Streptomyces sp. NPDC001139]